MTLVATADPTTGTIRIDIEQTVVLDNYTRVVGAGGWGNATPTGQPWTSWDGPAANKSVNGTRGLITLPSNGQGNGLSIDTGGTDMYLTNFSEIPVNGGGGTTIVVSLVGRFTNSSNYYFARIFLAGGGVQAALIVGKQVGPTATDLGNATLCCAHFAGLSWFIDFSICGNRLRATAWPSGQPRPGWLIDVTDFDLTSGTSAGVWDVALGGAPTPFTIQHDNFHAAVSQPIRLFRVTPDGVETEVRGSPGFTEEIIPVSTATATATFWDNEAPFDTDVFYVLKSACSDTVRITSNTVNLDSGGDGWLRDPVDPTRNLRIVMEDFFDECVDEDVIVFSGLADREYENASGIFDHIDARRPLTVSMTRKNYGSVLTLTSFSLDDVDVLENIFDPGRILSLSLPMEYGWAHRTFGTDYITCFDITQSLMGVDQRVTSRVWTIPFRLSLEPADTSEGGTGGNGIGGGGATYDDLMASAIGTTYNSLTAAGFNFLQIAQGQGY